VECSDLDTLWKLICTALVFVMQAGFCCLEFGLVRTKNSISVATKNLVDICIAGLLFWAFGFSLMFGASNMGLFGQAELFFESTNSHQVTTFLFQLMFCGAATTIVAGAVTERIRFVGYLIITTIIAAITYPLFGHWAWNEGGWLASFGFRDFAGSTVVHGVGAWVALAACMVIGPRTGRFDWKRSLDFVGHNLPVATLGVMLLWFGWFGFNAGSVEHFDSSVVRIAVCTSLSAMAGGLAALLLSWLILGYANALFIMNGVLAGLVGITAGCDCVTFGSAVLIGGFSGVVCVVGMTLFDRLKIDDVVSAVSVHGFGGVWGTLAVSLFAVDIGKFGHESRMSFFCIQLLGVLTCFVWAFGGGGGLILLANRFCPLRSSEDDENRGLNIADHNALNETDVLVAEMDEHRVKGDFSKPVSVESHSDIGLIANQYNRVLAAVENDREALLEADGHRRKALRELLTAQQELEGKIEELKDFNDNAVDRELRMVELKSEINDLCEQAGLAERYDVEFKEG